MSCRDSAGKSSSVCWTMRCGLMSSWTSLIRCCTSCKLQSANLSTGPCRKGILVRGFLPPLPCTQAPVSWIYYSFSPICLITCTAAWATRRAACLSAACPGMRSMQSFFIQCPNNIKPTAIVSDPLGSRWLCSLRQPPSVLAVEAYIAYVCHMQIYADVA